MGCVRVFGAMRCVKFTILLAFMLPEPVPAASKEIVRTWAETLGDELWNLNNALTKPKYIKEEYRLNNASVKKKDGKQILESSLKSVSAMLTKKIQAVKCIHATAEKLAQEFNYTMIDDPQFKEEFQYCSAKYSNFEYEQEEMKPEEKFDPPRFAINNPHYLNVTLEKDSHFYDINVNTNISCVHVPTNIYYEERDALNSILWSKGLNDIFTKNYKSDPSLSWQYFGSSRGILRFFPGMPWNKQIVDTYDCRVRSWYIEAATCSKDVIILFDVSGSMTGFKNYVARRTLRALLSTLSNNDYVNVYYFKNHTQEVVDCFKKLVQATPENIKTIEDKLEPKEKKGTGEKAHKIPLEGNANLTEAYIRAFTTLKERRNHCNVTSTQGCNQLVMVITDYVPGNLTEVFDEHNREVVDNNTYIPVRVFTYLIGKEVTNVREIQWMACLNRGYFVHIHSVEEVQQQVLKYINVIARPMILAGEAGEAPPPTWTHANIDDTRTKIWNLSSDIGKPDEDKLVTSVAIPAFDYKYNREHNDAILLGVAGTDVPIDSIAKLAQPHQLGVNGYPLIVSNNGYLLLHPLLIATINGELQENYNSVDFVEVEQVDDGKGPRELGDKIKQLRQALVNGVEGNMTGVEVLFHYDNMRRIARVSHDYFYNKLEGTPFSMGISLPRGYGDTELMLTENPLEAKHGQNLTKVNVTDYFRFNFRVHPDWVYCKYHYLEGHEAETSEIEIWRFLSLLSHNKTDITRQQYDETIKMTDFTFEKNCTNSPQLGVDDYYCTEDLVKQVIFDAKLSTTYFKQWKASEKEKALARNYNVSVRFIATSSGLTRWHYIQEKDEHKNERVNDDGTTEKNYSGTVFGDDYHNAIEETWYKAAVLQHMINKESLVIATRLPILDDTILNRPPVENEDGDITVTATYAIFYKDGDFETPASVVGFQYSYKKFYDMFKEIVQPKQRTRQKEEFVCGKGKYDCFVVDSSGYVVLSMLSSDNTGESGYNTSLVGQFFGAIDKDTRMVLQKLIDLTVFQNVMLFNYQALCPRSLTKESGNRGWTLTTPFSVAGNFIRWMLTEIVLLIMNWNHYGYAAAVIDDEDYNNNYYGTAEATTTAAPVANDTIQAQEKDEMFSCDHSIMLYILNQTFFSNKNGGPTTVHEVQGDCHPAFWASNVVKTNLLLVVVQRMAEKDQDYNRNCTQPPDTKPQPTKQSTLKVEPCHKLPLGQLPRRPLEGCFTYHEGEKNITACGVGSIARGSVVLFLTTALLGALASR